MEGLECQDVKMSKCQNEKWGWLLEKEREFSLYNIYIIIYIIYYK